MRHFLLTFKQYASLESFLTFLLLPFCYYVANFVLSVSHESRKSGKMGTHFQIEFHTYLSNLLKSAFTM